MVIVDLNADVGESYGHYTIGDDENLIPYLTSANIACGLHAGDPSTIAKAVLLCVDHGVKIGAHIGFSDIQGFGRRLLPIDSASLRELVIYQMGVMLGFCQAYGTKLNHVKLHGALYNKVAESYSLSKTLIETIRSIDSSVILYGLSGSSNELAARDLDHPFYAEVFSDRAYRIDGSLVPRTENGAMIHSPEVASQKMVHLIKSGQMITLSGEAIDLRVDTICLHGDKPDVIEHVQILRTALENEGIVIA